MQQRLTTQAQEQLRNIAQRFGVSSDAAQNLLDALQRGGGTMAQFNHPELGGYGQWMRGGMTMVGDMFNNSLKATVDGLCYELTRLLENNPFEPPPQNQSLSYGGSYQSQSSGGMNMQMGGNYGGWWPQELGQPSTSGAQNDMRYAYFPSTRRLAIQHNGVTTVYDTLDHQIGGVSQQQGGGYSVSFSSQYGQIDLGQLPIVSSDGPMRAAPSTASVPPPPSPPPAQYSAGGADLEQDIFAKIERLAGLRQNGVISEEEFAAKKAELLARI